VIESKNVGEHSLGQDPDTLPEFGVCPPLKPLYWRHYLPRSRPLSALLECFSNLRGLPAPFLSRGHALALMFVVLCPPCFAEILKQGSQHPHLGFLRMGLLLQLFCGLPTNLISNLPLPLSSWTPSFFLLLESLVVPTLVLALLTPSQFVVLPPCCLLRRYFHYLHFPPLPIFKIKQCL
jgi:hypothetical protein